jgi:mRNA interferase MazF
MAIQYPVALGTLLLCDYSLGGFKEPEMVKRRPAIVVSPRLPHRDRLCTVVPISSSPGVKELDYIVRLHFALPLPEPFDYETVWAKCDMLATVSFERLELFRTGRDHTGKRRYLQPRLPDLDFVRVRQGILFALGIKELPL